MQGEAERGEEGGHEAERQVGEGQQDVGGGQAQPQAGDEEQAEVHEADDIPDGERAASALRGERQQTDRKSVV